MVGSMQRRSRSCVRSEELSNGACSATRHLLRLKVAHPVPMKRGDDVAQQYFISSLVASPLRRLMLLEAEAPQPTGEVHVGALAPPRRMIG